MESHRRYTPRWGAGKLNFMPHRCRTDTQRTVGGVKGTGTHSTPRSNPQAKAPSQTTPRQVTQGHAGDWGHISPGGGGGWGVKECNLLTGHRPASWPGVGSPPQWFNPGAQPLWIYPAPISEQMARHGSKCELCSHGVSPAADCRVTAFCGDWVSSKQWALCCY